jgi:hypothetical protein
MSKKVLTNDQQNSLIAVAFLYTENLIPSSKKLWKADIYNKEVKEF